MGRASKEFTFELVEAPDRTHNGVYDTIIDEFVKAVLENPAAEVGSAKVAVPGRQIKTVQVGLSKAAHQAGRKDVMVSIRDGDIYLIKK